MKGFLRGRDMSETVIIPKIDMLLLQLMHKHFVSKCPETGLIWVRVAFCSDNYPGDFDEKFLDIGYHCVNVEPTEDCMEYAYEKI